MRIPTGRLSRSSDFKTHIVIEKLGETDDGRGGFTEVWSRVGEFQARVEPISAQDRYMAGAANDDIAHKITIRWPFSFTIESGMRLLIGTREIAIKGVTNVAEANRYMEILGTE